MTNSFINTHQQRFNTYLARVITQTAGSAIKLEQAMQYAALNGGKRVRPLLTYATGHCVGAEIDALDAPAVALELIHCYSLVHDDLPAMDDDDLRRGKPTCHKVYGDALAILAGDALQTEAFSQLAGDDNNNAEKRVKMFQVLSRASGVAGMAGGQALDIAATGQAMQLQGLQTMHALKTGALITASVQLGAIAGDADEGNYQALTLFAEKIGLAFQIQDDVLDVESDTSTLGKRQGADADLNKVTYPALLGVEKAKALALETYESALTELDKFTEQAKPLRQLAAYIVQRKY